MVGQAISMVATRPVMADHVTQEVWLSPRDRTAARWVDLDGLCDEYRLAEIQRARGHLRFHGRYFRVERAKKRLTELLR
jgi:hypothetical protein